MLEIDIHENSSIIFDCDGVLLDSNKIKIKVFKDILKKYKFPESKIKNFINYHKKNAGISRYKKIDLLFNQMKLSDVYLKKRILFDISKKIEINLIKLSFTKGCKKFLQYLYKRKIKTFILTGSDEKELKRIFTKKNYKKYFNFILGRPNDKHKNFKKIKKNISLKVNNYYFGDSKLDYEVAKKNRINFIFVKDFTDQPSFIKKKEQRFNVIKNFSKLKFH